MLAYPTQLVVRALGASATGRQTETAEPFLAEWVFTVVYGGFILQGLALGALFVLYARERWGRVWAGRISDLPAPRRVEAVGAATVAALTAVPLLMHLVWVGGHPLGLTEARAAARNADFYALEGAFLLLAVATLVATLAWAGRWWQRLPLCVPAGIAVVGSAGLAGWGGWLLLVAAVNTDAAQQSTGLMTLTHVIQAALGLAVLWHTARFARAFS